MCQGGSFAPMTPDYEPVVLRAPRGTLPAMALLVCIGTVMCVVTAVPENVPVTFVGMIGVVTGGVGAWDTIVKRLTIGKNGLTKRDFWLRQMTIPFATISVIEFDEALGLLIYADDRLVVRWPPRAGAVAEFADILRHRVGSARLDHMSSPADSRASRL
jgi:hypothetical protein